MAARRPFGVTLVAVIAWISGALQIVLGALVLFAPVVWLGILLIALGLITILVSVGLFGGRNGARLIMAIVFVLNICSAAYLALTHPEESWTAVIDCIVPLVGMVLLFSPKANAYFGS